MLPEISTSPVPFCDMLKVFNSVSSKDMKQARAVRNPDVAPHLSFLDFGGHGYGLVTATSDQLSTEFVCIPRPLERSERPDGGPLT